MESDRVGGAGAGITPFKAKVEEKAKHTLRVCKLQIIPTFQLLDEDGTVIDEVVAGPVLMYPGKYLEFKVAVAKLEADANKQDSQIADLLKRPLW